MKKLLLILAAVGLLAMSASAQTPRYGYQPITLPGINTGVPTGNASGTTNVLMGTNYTVATAPVIGQLTQRYIAVSETHYTLGSAGSTNTYLFAPSVDGVNYDTNAANDITFVAKNTIGQGPVTTTTNWDTQGIGYYKLISISTNAPATNTSLSWGFKQLSP